MQPGPQHVQKLESTCLLSQLWSEAYGALEKLENPWNIFTQNFSLCCYFV